MKNIYIFLISLVIFGICAYNVNNIIIQAESTGNLIIALLVAALLLGAFSFGMKTLKINKMAGTLLIVIAVGCEIGIAYLLIQNISEKQLNVNLTTFNAQSIEEQYIPSIDSAKNANSSILSGIRNKIQKLGEYEISKRQNLTEKLRASILDSSNAVLSLTSKMQRNIAEEKARIERENKDKMQNEMGIKKVANMVLAVINLLLYIIYLLVYFFAPNPTGNDDIFKLIKSKMYLQKDLMDTIERIEAENSGLRDMVQFLEPFEQKCKILAKKLEESTIKYNESTNEVQKNSIELKKVTEMSEKLALQYNDLVESVQKYTNAGITIYNFSLIVFHLREGKLTHEIRAKKGSPYELLNERLEIVPKEKKDKKEKPKLEDIGNEETGEFSFKVIKSA